MNISLCNLLGIHSILVRERAVLCFKFGVQKQELGTQNNYEYYGEDFTEIMTAEERI